MTPLFADGALSDYFDGRYIDLAKEIEGLTKDYILQVSENDLFNYLVDKYKIDPPCLRLDEKHILPPEESTVDARHDPSRLFYMAATKITIVVPFDGDLELFHLRPSTHFTNYPLGVIEGKELHIIFNQIDADASAIQTATQEQLNLTTRYLDYVKTDIESFNNNLISVIRQRVPGRKNKILEGEGLAQSLGLPIRRRGNVPQTYKVPLEQRRAKINRPQSQGDKFYPEPALDEFDYENILNIRTYAVAGNDHQWRGRE